MLRILAGDNFFTQEIQRQESFITVKQLPWCTTETIIFQGGLKFGKIVVNHLSVQCTCLTVLKVISCVQNQIRATGFEVLPPVFSRTGFLIEVTLCARSNGNGP